MATRLDYALPIARQFLRGASRRLRPGGLAASLPQSAEGKPFVIVTGAGRSGTSAVARVLHESGARMGGELGAPSDVNQDGFYEEMSVVRQNDRMLAGLGMTDARRPERWPWRSTVLAIGEDYREEMEALISKAGDGWKDPRFAVTLEAWLPRFPTPPKVVVCLRSPRAQAESVIRGYGFVDREAVERQWARHNRRLLEVIRDYGLEAMCVQYDTLVERPEKTVAALARFVGHPLKAEYVNPKRRRFARSVPEKHARLYEEVRALNGDVSPADAGAADARRAGGDSGTSPVHDTGQGEAARHDDSGARAIDSYARQIDEIDALVRASKAVWAVQVGLPRPKLDGFERLGLTLPQAMEKTRSASAAYAATLKSAQERLEALDPPPGFERHHELMQHEVNLERMVAELMLSALAGPAPDRWTWKRAVAAWRRFGRGSAVEKAQERRGREYAHALNASGYLDARRRWPR